MSIPMYYRMIFSSKEKFDFVLVAVIILKLNTSHALNGAARDDRNPLSNAWKARDSP